MHPKSQQQINLENRNEEENEGGCPRLDPREIEIERQSQGKN
jgi:hypothetical protein